MYCRWLALFAFSGLLSYCEVAGERKPRIISANGSHSLELPPEMRSAIAKRYPGLSLWTDAEHAPSIVKSYKFTRFQAPFAVIGDFNGDSRLDVSFLASMKEQQLHLTMTSESLGGYRFHNTTELANWPPREESVEVSGRSEYGSRWFLRYVPRPFPNITTPGFDLTSDNPNWGIERNIYFWRDGNYWVRGELFQPASPGSKGIHRVGKIKRVVPEGLQH